MLPKLVAIAAIAVAVVAGVFVYFSYMSTSNSVPNVKFVEFNVDKTDIKVGESSTVTFNVESQEQQMINNTKVAIVITPSGYQPYLTVDKQTTVLPVLAGKGARTGEESASITAVGVPAQEATYSVKAILYAENVQSDIKNFDLHIHQ